MKTKLSSTDLFFDDIKEPEKLRIAIVLPVYNTSLYLQECLNSLIQQSHTNFIVFAIDDGSTDDSGNILDAYAAKDKRIRVSHIKNGGVSAARNYALKKIEEDGCFHLVAFCDSDDFVSPDFLQLYAYGATKFRAQFITIGYTKFNKDGVIQNRKKVKHPPISLTGENLLSFGLTLHSRSSKSPATAYFLNNVALCAWLIRGVRFDQNRSIGEDAEYRFRVILRLTKGVAFSDIGYHYRIRKSSLSNQISLSSLCSELELYLGWQREEKIPLDFSKNIKHLLYKKFRQIIIWAYEHDELDRLWEQLRVYHKGIRKTSVFPSAGIDIFFLFLCGSRILKSYLYFIRREARSSEEKLAFKMISAFD